jgi:hypothetical protein
MLYAAEHGHTDGIEARDYPLLLLLLWRLLGEKILIYVVDSTKVLSGRSFMPIISGYEGCYSAHPGLSYMVDTCKLN